MIQSDSVVQEHFHRHRGRTQRKKTECEPFSAAPPNRAQQPSRRRRTLPPGQAAAHSPQSPWASACFRFRAARANTVFASFQNADLVFDNTPQPLNPTLPETTPGLFSAGSPLQVTFEFDENVTADGVTYTADEPIKATVTLSSEVNGFVSGTRNLDQALQDGTLKFTDAKGDNLLTISGFTGDITGRSGGSTGNLDTDTTLPPAEFPDHGTYSSDFLRFAPANDVVNSTALTLTMSGTVNESTDSYLGAFSANADGSFSGNVSAIPEPSAPCILCVAAIALLLDRRRPRLRAVRAEIRARHAANLKPQGLGVAGQGRRRMKKGCKTEDARCEVSVGRRK